MPSGSDDGRPHPDGATPGPTATASATGTVTDSADRAVWAVRPPASGPVVWWRRGPLVVAFSIVTVFLAMSALLIWQATHSDWRRTLPTVDGVPATTAPVAPQPGATEVTRP